MHNLLKLNKILHNSPRHRQHQCPGEIEKLFSRQCDNIKVNFLNKSSYLFWKQNIKKVIKGNLKCQPRYTTILSVTLESIQQVALTHHLSQLNRAIPPVFEQLNKLARTKSKDREQRT